MKTSGKENAVTRAWHNHPLAKRVRITEPLRPCFVDYNGEFVPLESYHSNVQDQPPGNATSQPKEEK